MDGVERVEQLDDKHLRWVTKVAGVKRDFDAEITEQAPDQRIAWKSTTGTTQAGVVTFHRLDEGQTKVMLQMEIAPEGVVEKVGDMAGFVQRQVNGAWSASRSSSRAGRRRPARGGAGLISRPPRDRAGGRPRN